MYLSPLLMHIQSLKNVKMAFNKANTASPNASKVYHYASRASDNFNMASHEIIQALLFQSKVFNFTAELWYK